MFKIPNAGTQAYKLYIIFDFWYYNMIVSSRYFPPPLGELAVVIKYDM